MIEHTDPQGSDAWHEARRGVPTASRASDARNRTNGLTKQQNAFVNAMREGRTESEAMAIAGYKKRPTADGIDLAIAGTLPLKWGDTAISYAKELARERNGGKNTITTGFGAMRIGHEEEPFAAIAYVAETGATLEEVGFITTDDRRFGLSLDRRVVGQNGAVEIKTMVSSSTLFTAIVDGDISEYRDQCLFALWMLALDWVDLCLWAPDMSYLHIVRIVRDEDEIQRLEDDLLAFEGLVDEHERKLRAAMTGRPAPAPQVKAIASSVIDGSPAATPDDPPISRPAPAPAAARAPVVASTAPVLDELLF